MAKQTLPTNFKDDVLNTSMGGKRKWNITQNSDGTYSITDVTDYSQVGSEFGAGELNATNQAVNESADAGKIIDDPDTAGATTQNGYIAGVQLFNHLNDSLGSHELLSTTYTTTNTEYNLSDDINNYKMLLLVCSTTASPNLGGILGTAYIPVEAFKKSSFCRFPVIISSSGAFEQVSVSYKSDTSVSVSGSNTRVFTLYGVI